MCKENSAEISSVKFGTMIFGFHISIHELQVLRYQLLQNLIPFNLKKSAFAAGAAMFI